VNRMGYAIYRLMGSSFGSITIRPRLEVCFEDRFQNQLQRPLHHAVTDRGNRENVSFRQACMT